MSIDLWPVGEDFAAEIGDVKLSLPISKNLAEEILTAYNTYAVLIFPNQRLTQDSHVRFAKIFGDIDHSMVADMEMAVPRVPTEIADVSNLGSDGSVLDEDHRMIGFQRGNRLWHTDSSFKHVPANASCLYMQSIPPVGGQTEFADMRAAWDSVRLNAVTISLRIHAFCSRFVRSVPLGGVSSLVTRKLGVANSFENALIIGNYQEFGGRWPETFVVPSCNMPMLDGN
mgnify:CR=1 FL=1